MIVHIDTSVMDKCWNPYDSYGEICIHCGCCSSDKSVRYPARIKVLERRIAENENFEYWDDDPEWRAVQEKNVKANLRHFKRQLRYYKGKMNDNK